MLLRHAFMHLFLWIHFQPTVLVCSFWGWGILSLSLEPVINEIIKTMETNENISERNRCPIEMICLSNLWMKKEQYVVALVSTYGTDRKRNWFTYGCIRIIFFNSNHAEMLRSKPNFCKDALVSKIGFRCLSSNRKNFHACVSFRASSLFRAIQILIRQRILPH